MAVGDKLTGVQKTAIVLASLGEQFAAEIFKQMDEEEIRQVGLAMSKLNQVDAKVVDAVLMEFLEKLRGDSGPLVGGSKTAQRALALAMGEDAARDIIADMERSIEPVPFERVKTVDSKTLASFIKSEHPQTIAVILSHLPQMKAAEVLREFPENLQYDVVLRISNLDVIPPGIIEEIDAVLQREIVSTEGAEAKQLGGVEAVAELLNNVDKATEEHIFGRLEEDDPEMAEKIRQLMFVFEDLINVDDRGIRTLLKEVRNEDLTVALKTSSEDLRAKILGNVSERAAAMIQEDLEVMGPVRLSEVEQSQQKIIQIARRLEKEGKIAIGGKGGEDVLV
ncbi:flagellar motor switch protein FliG [Desulfarculus baarsii DSM 2075]|uniref:Flagellar motor switch protein FliG n=1 Tax=Desulfarculus baarsii (strain ATCC 33931 / DSM 2075 / LMG 7858 / VKM B-1802 / 2st14) TaxID=644282 RepID=E1QFE7_DESB2|nr:flagellar motor switch protein FliG [Desulfarculus baarsii]ADK84283.1 flagellar motor switch protein FliG [Desulfarculus baarsii DSM 2075]